MTAVRYWTESSKEYVKQRRADAETEFGSLVVVQQVIFFQISEETKSCSAMVRPKVQPFVIEVTYDQAGEEIRGGAP